MPSLTIQCSRCGREAEVTDAGNVTTLPDGWEGSVNNAVCPGCQYAEWHPHCTSPVDVVDGERVDIAAMPREEIDPDRLRHCGYIDLSVSVTDGDEDWPTEWHCPRCGGTTFEWVHRDYLPSGVQPGRARFRRLGVVDETTYEVVRVLEDSSFVLRDSAGDVTVFEPSSPNEVVEVQCDVCGKWGEDVAPAGGSWICFGGHA